MTTFTVTESMGGTVLKHHTVSATTPEEAAMSIADASSVYIGDGNGHTGMKTLMPHAWATKSGINRTAHRFKVSGFVKSVLTDFVLSVEEKTPGRPEGSVKPEGREATHGITISDEAWSKAKATGNASGYIERLILSDKE